MRRVLWLVCILSWLMFCFAAVADQRPGVSLEPSECIVMACTRLLGTELDIVVTGTDDIGLEFLGLAYCLQPCDANWTMLWYNCSRSVICYHTWKMKLDKTGKWEFVASANDTAGQWAERAGPLMIDVIEEDKPPQVSIEFITCPAPCEMILGEALNVSMHARDELGVSHLWLGWDGSERYFACEGRRTCNRTISLSLGRIGKLAFELRANDTSNQWSLTSSELSVRGICNETDDGDRPEMGGIVEDITGSYTDRCLFNNLTEFFCSEGLGANKTYDCEAYCAALDMMGKCETKEGLGFCSCESIPQGVWVRIAIVVGMLIGISVFFAILRRFLA